MLFKSAAKMLRITASGDDAGVGSKVPSTPADSSKVVGTTLPPKSVPASSYNVGDAGNARVAALINKMPPSSS